MPTVHFLCGYMGFGKSTIARRLALQYNAVILNDDEFIRRLFGRNLPERQFRQAHDKVTKFTWELGERIVSIGTSVIFDRGFWSRESRKNAVERAEKFCDSILFHQIECDMKTAKQRVLSRTAENEDALEITEATFDLFAERYEPISPDEKLNVIYYRNTLPLF